MNCPYCPDSEYQTIKRLKWIVPGEYATVVCKQCPSCGDIIFTHKQSLKFDSTRRKHKQPKLKYVLEVIET